MKILRVTAKNFKHCTERITIDFVPRAKKTQEDKEYELEEIHPGLFVFKTMAFMGKNASGKTTAIELLNYAYNILGNFRVSGPFDNTEMEIYFFEKGSIYRYVTVLNVDNGKSIFSNQRVYRTVLKNKRIGDIFDLNRYSALDIQGILPDDTSILFFISKQLRQTSVYFDSEGLGASTYLAFFNIIKKHNISANLWMSVVQLFDENIESLTQIDSGTYSLTICGEEKLITAHDLFNVLSSGTTKGMLLYLMMIASLKEGFDLLIDEIENHFHRTLVFYMISLYRNPDINRHGATLIFTTHYSEILDLMGRQDNIWLARSNKSIVLENMYDTYHLRSGVSKSNLYNSNAFDNTVSYERLMSLQRELRK